MGAAGADQSTGLAPGSEVVCALNRQRLLLRDKEINVWSLDLSYVAGLCNLIALTLIRIGRYSRLNSPYCRKLKLSLSLRLGSIAVPYIDRKVIPGPTENRNV